ncbi:hypothetical protein FACS189421_13170 [Bacteroidia bacterium]|nr:hypothetical protein FACS189421_13170 [Bacteroidia bacterium]
MGCVKLHILDEQYKNTELRVSYFNKELTLNNSAENPRRWTLVRFVDPTGKDVWQLDENGNIIQTITHDADGNRLTYDRIEIHGGDGNVLGQTSDYALGTITHETVTVGKGDNAWSYDKFSVNGTDNASAIFQTVAENTGVEWSHSVFQESATTGNYLITSHEKTVESGFNNFFGKQLDIGNPLVDHTHSHPYPMNIAIPSGVFPGQRGDIQFADYITNLACKMTNTTPNFYLYVSKTGEVIPYSKDSNTTTHKKYIDKYYGR